LPKTCHITLIEPQNQIQRRSRLESQVTERHLFDFYLAYPKVKYMTCITETSNKSYAHATPNFSQLCNSVVCCSKQFFLSLKVPEAVRVIGKHLSHKLMFYFKLFLSHLNSKCTHKQKLQLFFNKTQHTKPENFDSDFYQLNHTEQQITISLYSI